VVLFSAFFAGACGGGGDPFASLADEQDFGDPISNVGSETAAAEAVTAAQSLVGLTELDTVDASSLDFLGNSFDSIGAILGPVTTTTSFAAPEGMFGGKGAFASSFDECVVVGENEVVFNDCIFGEQGFEGGVSGFIRVDAGRLTVDLSASASGSEEGASFSFGFGFTADVTVTATSLVGRIDATVTARVSSGGQSASASGSAAVIYNVVLEDDCAVGGDIKVGMEASVNAPGESESFRAVGQATFGPACNEVSVTARLD